MDNLDRMYLEKIKEEQYLLDFLKEFVSNGGNRIKAFAKLNNLTIDDKKEYA
ncbi:MAG: hypothetical protein ACFFDY_00215 [Candidatus Thorarchaeota archaeon]